MANEVRIGRISAIDYAAGMVRVVYADSDNNVTMPMPLLAGEYNMPEIGEQVIVLHLSNGSEAGVVLGKYWNNKNLPPEGEQGVFRKELGRTPGAATIRYDGDTLSISCSGNVTIKADGNFTIDAARVNLG
jgi:phage baseplate assembly protein V